MKEVRTFSTHFKNPKIKIKLILNQAQIIWNVFTSNYNDCNGFIMYGTKYQPNGDLATSASHLHHQVQVLEEAKPQLRIYALNVPFFRS